MITARPYMSLLAAFSLLIVSARAHADCAWVLWNDELRLDSAAGIESRSWHSIASASKKTECEARLREEIGRVTRPDHTPKDVRFKVIGDAVQVTYYRPDKPDEKTSRVQTFRYVCLPSTIDPRAPQPK
jgi:hypothetical protein